MYHTQESRGNRLTSPLKCTDPNAWLGFGYYFWLETEDAIRWGYDSKTRRGAFDVYLAAIDCENVLDTVFNESHYLLWKRAIEKVGKNFLVKTNQKLTIKQLNDYFREQKQWNNIHGILFQDLPQNEMYLLVQKFYYRKRIQLVVYEQKIVMSFSHYSSHLCS